jgi:hypothetical protein
VGLAIAMVAQEMPEFGYGRGGVISATAIRDAQHVTGVRIDELDDPRRRWGFAYSFACRLNQRGQSRAYSSGDGRQHQLPACPVAHPSILASRRKQ